MKKKRIVLQILFLAFLIVGSVYEIRSSRTRPYQHNEGFVFGTTYSFTYQCDSDLNHTLLQELRKVDMALSTFNENSTVSRINRNQPHTLDTMFLSVYRLAQDVSGRTDGAFDVTVAPLVNAWGFGFKKGRFPTDESVDSMLRHVGYKRLALREENGRWQLEKADSCMMLDFSAIAKGYGSDLVADCLRRHGVDNFMVEIGGEIVVSGCNKRQEPWRIGVTRPADDSLGTAAEVQTVLPVTDKAMATSGNYRNFYYKDGQKYAHTIDPKTGRPVTHNLLSATVMAGTCAKADAYATAFMVMGLDKAKRVLEDHPELEAYFIYADKDNNYQTWTNVKCLHP